MADKDEKPKVPKHIETYYKNRDKVNRLIDTTNHHHRSAYDSAVAKHLLNDSGEVDYSKLKDAKVQESFADHMADFYIDKAFTYFGFKKEHEPLTKGIKGDVFKKDMLLKSYAGITSSELKRYVQSAKDKFTFAQFDKLREEMMKEVTERLTSSAIGHLNDSHLEDIVNYTGAGSLINKDYLKLGDALKLLDVHKEFDGKLPDYKVLESVLGENASYLLKKKEKKK